MPWWLGALIGCVGIIGGGIAYIKGYKAGYDDGYYKNRLPKRKNHTPPKF